MRKENYFKSTRWNAGIGNSLQSALGSSLDDESEREAIGDGALAAVLEPVANLALTYYDKRIRAYFARGGIDIGDDVLTVESIKKKIEASTGLEIAELTAEGFLLALEKPIARAVSELLGFVVTKVLDREEFRRQVKTHVLQRLVDGEGGGVVTGRALHQLRDAATWAQSGLSSGDRRRLMNRVYQKRYRRTHAQTWTSS